MAMQWFEIELPQGVLGLRLDAQEQVEAREFDLVAERAAWLMTGRRPDPRVLVGLVIAEQVAGADYAPGEFGSNVGQARAHPPFWLPPTPSKRELAGPAGRAAIVAHATKVGESLTGAVIVTAMLERIAGDPETPALLLEWLSADQRLWRSMAGNPSAPEPVLRRICAEGSEGVRTTLAENPSLPEDLLMRLLSSEDALVRVAAAFNPSLTEPMAERLLEDPDTLVRQKAAQRLALMRLGEHSL